jgi:hypothetical protein
MFDRSPPIARLSHRILADVENAVRRFPRFHKFSVGADLRFQAMQVARCIHKAWRDPEHRLPRVMELCSAVDDLKISMQLGKQVRAFGSFAEFEALARLVNELGQQSGGWLKKLQSMGQNAAAREPSQRAQILSTQAAHEAIT